MGVIGERGKLPREDKGMDMEKQEGLRANRLNAIKSPIVY